MASYACSSGRLFFNARLRRPALLVVVVVVVVAVVVVIVVVVVLVVVLVVVCARSVFLTARRNSGNDPARPGAIYPIKPSIWLCFFDGL